MGQSIPTISHKSSRRRPWGRRPDEVDEELIGCCFDHSQQSGQGPSSWMHGIFGNWCRYQVQSHLGSPCSWCELRSFRPKSASPQLVSPQLNVVSMFFHTISKVSVENLFTLQVKAWKVYWVFKYNRPSIDRLTSLTLLLCECNNNHLFTCVGVLWRTRYVTIVKLLFNEM